MQSTHRSFKLKNLRLTLSKYDAKYSKTSAVLDDDTSDDGEEGGTELEGTSRSLSTAPPRIIHQGATLVVHDRAEASVGETVQPYSIALAKLPQGHESELAMLHDQSTPPPTIDDNYISDTSSSLASVETDSEIGFNVHSVSSLAESVLPLEEKTKLDSSALAIGTEFQNLPQSITVLSVSSSSGGSLMKNVRDTADVALNMPGRNESLSSSCNKSESDTGNKVEVVAVSSTSATQNKSEKSCLHVEDLMLNLENTESLSASESTSFNLSKKEAESLKRMINRNKYYDPTNRNVSVAVQTSSYDDHVRKTGSTSLKSKHAVVAAPLVKPLQLPIFVRDGYGISTNASLDERKKTALESEVEKLVSHHLDLVRELLERQHRLYMANYKAVQLLERGYKENSLERSFNKVNLDGQGTTEEGTGKMRPKSKIKKKRYN